MQADTIHFLVLNPRLGIQTQGSAEHCSLLTGTGMEEQIFRVAFSKNLTSKRTRRKASEQLFFHPLQWNKLCPFWEKWVQYYGSRVQGYPSTFWKSTLCHFAFAKDLHQYLFLLNDRNPKKNSYFTKKVKSKISIQCVLQWVIVETGALVGATTVYVHYFCFTQATYLSYHLFYIGYCHFKLYVLFRMIW